MSRRRSFRGMIEQHFSGLRKSQRTTIYALVQGLLYRSEPGWCLNGRSVAGAA